jgi:hypothetical protein
MHTGEYLHHSQDYLMLILQHLDSGQRTNSPWLHRLFCRNLRSTFVPRRIGLAVHILGKSALTCDRLTCTIAIGILLEQLTHH